MVSFQVDQSQILKMFHTSMLMQGLLFRLKHIYFQCNEHEAKATGRQVLGCSNTAPSASALILVSAKTP